MNYRKRKQCAFLCSILLIIFLAGCSNTTTQTNPSGTESDLTKTEDNNISAVSENTSDLTSTDNTIDMLNADDMFTDRDKETGYDEQEAIAVTLSDNSSTCSSSAVDISSNTITISKEGTYILNGSLTNGQIIIDTDDSSKVRLILNGVNINCNTSAAIYVKEADKVFITLASETGNILTNQEEFISIDDNNIDAVIFSKSDLTLNGNGTLTLWAAYGHGIVSKDDLVITGGTYNITSASSSLSGKDSVRIADGSFSLTSGKDAIHSENEDNTEKGFIYIEGGSFTIESSGDGLYASSILQIENGNFDITTGGGSSNAVQKTNDMFPGRQQGEMAGSRTEENSSEDSVSTKGMKSDIALFIVDGTITVNSADDSLHSNGIIEISSGVLNLSSGDDGIHADDTVLINEGTINIPTSYEGIEGQSITINGGEISIYSTDDGMNAAGGADSSGFGGGMKMDTFASDNNCCITINGGTIQINAYGDGIDSNGNLLVTGGKTYISGPSDNGNAALDYNGDATITGGIFVAAGSSGMAQNFGSSSTQGSMMITVTTSSSNDEITLQDSAGNTILTYTPEKTYNSVLISCPEIIQGNTYTLFTGAQASTVEMTSLIYGTGMNGMGNMHGGMNDNRANDNRINDTGTKGTDEFGGFGGGNGHHDNNFAPDNMPSPPDNNNIPGDIPSPPDGSKDFSGNTSVPPDIPDNSN